MKKITLLKLNKVLSALILTIFITTSSLYSQVDANTIAYWKFENNLLDETTNNLDGTINNAVSLINASPAFTGAGYYASFAGTTPSIQNAPDYISVPDNVVFDAMASAFTIEAWIHLDASAQTATIIDRNNYNFTFQANHNNLGKLGFSNNSQNGNNYWYQSNTDITTEVWHHVAVTWENDINTGTGTLKFYLDGVLDGMHTINSIVFPSGGVGGLNIGRQDPNFCQCHTMQGDIDELRLSNIARTASEISNTANNITPITNANILTAVNAWYSDSATAEVTYGHIKDWDVSNVTDMSSLFTSKRNFSPDISGWDVSNVTNMYNMFHDAREFNADISGWDVSKVTNMDFMLAYTTNFVQDLSNWCVSNIGTTPQNFFHYAALNNHQQYQPVWGTCPAATPADTTPPVITDVTMLSNNIHGNGYAKEGNEISLTFTSSEPINTPTVTIAGQPATVSNIVNDWTAKITVASNDPQGSASFSISNISDIANNSISDITTVDLGIATVIDTQKPLISSISLVSDNADASFAKLGDKITLTFTSNEQINIPTVTIAGQPANVSKIGNDWSATITVDQNSIEGYVSFSISNTSDIVGNFRTDINVNSSSSAGVLIDVTSPTVVTQDISVQLDASGNATITPSQINNGSSDNFTSAANLTLAIDNSTFDCSNLGSALTTGSALNFGGDQEGIDLGDASQFNFNHNTPFTIESWVKTSGGYYTQIFQKANPTTSKGYTFQVSSSGQVQLMIFAPGQYEYFVNATTPINDNTWHHVAVTYDGTGDKSGVQFYIDGNPDQSVIESGNYANNGDFDSTGQNASIGFWDPLGAKNWAFIGAIDDVRIWNVARTANEITNSYNTPLSGTENGLVGYYKLDEGTGNIATDSSPFANNGTIHNIEPADWISSVPNGMSSTSNQVTLTIEDEAGNSSTATANITVVDNIDPTLTITNGDVTHEAFTTYTDAGATTTDNCSSSITSTINNVPANPTPGTYTVVYTATDSSGNTVTATRTVTVTDTVAPSGYSITNVTDPVIPSNEATFSFEATGLENPSTYNWTITDSNNATITGSGSSTQATITQDVSTLADGTLTISFTSTDPSSNTGDAVTLTTTKDTNGPVIVLTGTNPQTLELNNIYTEQGVTSVNDNIDGVLDPNNVAINTSALDITTVGRYNIVYTIDDARGNTGTATRLVHVMDTKPTVENDAITVLKNSTDNIINVLANDCFGTFGPNTDHSLTLINGKSNIITAKGGSIAVNNNGTPNNFLDDFISYTPEGDFSGLDSFTYTITDTNGVAATATVTVTVSTTNANGYLADTFTVAQDSNNNELDVMANDTDDASFGATDTRFLIESVDHLTGTTEYGGVVTLNTKGTANDTSDDVINYTPKAGFFGTDTFRYIPGNNRNDYVLVTVIVTEGAPNVNGTPTAVDDIVTITHSSTNNVINVLADNGNGADDFGSDGYLEDGLRMPNGTFSGASEEGGTLSINTKGTVDTTDDVFIYTPPTDITITSDTFEYTITDASGDADTGKVFITLSTITNVPVAIADAANTTKNTLVSIPVIDGDINGAGADSFGTDGRAVTPDEHLVVVANSVSTGATVVVNGDNIEYTPATDFIGVDTFNYTIEDSNGDTATATVTVTVSATPNGTPTAVDDTETVAQGSTTLFDVLGNDDYGTDGANTGHPLTFSNGSTVNASAEGGAISVVTDNGTSKISYTPAPGFSGVDSIVYVITDLSGDADQATVNITVISNGISSEPTAVDDFETVIPGATLLIDVLDNDDVGEGLIASGGLTMTNGTLSGASTEGGTISVIADTNDNNKLKISYTAFKGAVATDTDTFQYTITDASGDASTATVTITIGIPATNVPVAVNDTASTLEDTLVSIPVIAGNGTGAGADSFGTDGAAATDFLVVNVASVTAGATVVVNGNNIDYTPPTGFKGVDTFTYTIEDLTGDTATATVTVTVSAEVLVNGTPTANDDTIDIERYNWTTADPIVYLDVLDNDDFGSDGAITRHPALNFKGGKLEIVSAQGRRIRIDDNGTAADYSDDRIAYYATGNVSVTTDSFEYTITDKSGDADQATVTINYLDVAPPKTGDDTTNSNAFVTNEFTAYPNPSNGNVITTVFSTSKTKAVLSLYDVRGMEVYRAQLDLKAGKNTIQNTFNVKAGVMFIKIYNAETNFGIKKMIFK